MNGMPGFVSPIISPPPAGPPCKILPDPNSDKYCGAVSLGGHTALDNPICAECYEAIRVA